MSDRSISTPEMLRLVLQSHASELWTHVVAVVVAESSPPGFVDVQPQVKRTLPDADDLDLIVTDPLPLPIVPNVRVAHLIAAGGISIVFPCDIGTIGLLLVETVSSDEYLENGQLDPLEIGDTRTHHIANAKFLPCVWGAGATAPTIDAATLTISAPTVKLGDSTASDFVALASKCDQNFDALQALLGGGLSGIIAPVGGGQVTGSATFSPVAVGATKVKAK